MRSDLSDPISYLISHELGALGIASVETVRLGTCEVRTRILGCTGRPVTIQWVSWVSHGNGRCWRMAQLASLCHMAGVRPTSRLGMKISRRSKTLGKSIIFLSAASRIREEVEKNARQGALPSTCPQFYKYMGGTACSQDASPPIDLHQWISECKL